MNIAIVIIVLSVLLLAGLFSALETAVVAISEHQLLSLKHRFLWASYAYKLKRQLSQVLIFSLFGNSVFNTIFTTLSIFFIVKLIALFAAEQVAYSITTFLIALFIIIFSEALPKIIAAKSPNRTLSLLVIPFYYVFLVTRPAIYLIDKIVACISNLVPNAVNSPSFDELREIIADESVPFKDNHRFIMLNSIDLESITIREVLIPMRSVEVIDFADDVEFILQQIHTSHHTRIIVYKNHFNNILGSIHLKDVLGLPDDEITHDMLSAIIKPLSHVYDFWSVVKQIHHAQVHKEQLFVVLNEYGDVLGIACLDDMFEMMVGSFTTDAPYRKSLVVHNDSNELIVDGIVTLRELSLSYGLKFISRAFTLNGLILDMYDGIPNVGMCFKLNSYILEIISVRDYWVDRVKIILP